MSSKFAADKFALVFARIENHYFMNHGFFEEGQLIQNAHRLAGIPCAIIQGRYDVATPVKTAWDLHKAWPEAAFHLRGFTPPNIPHPELLRSYPEWRPAYAFERPAGRDPEKTL